MSIKKSLTRSSIAAGALLASLGLAAAQSGGSAAGGGSSSGSGAGSSSGSSVGAGTSTGATGGSPTYSIGPNAATGLAASGGPPRRGAEGTTNSRVDEPVTQDFPNETVRCADGSTSKLGHAACLGGR